MAAQSRQWSDKKKNEGKRREKFIWNSASSNGETVDIQRAEP